MYAVRVRHLYAHTTKADVQCHFGGVYSSIKSVNFFTDRRTPGRRKVAIVEYVKESDAKEVVANLNGSVLDSSILVVERAE